MATVLASGELVGGGGSGAGGAGGALVTTAGAEVSTIAGAGIAGAGATTGGATLGAAATNGAGATGGAATGAGAGTGAAAATGAARGAGGGGGADGEAGGGCDGPTTIGAMPSSVFFCFGLAAGTTSLVPATGSGAGWVAWDEASGTVGGSSVGGSGSSHDAVKRSERRSASLSLSGAPEGRWGSGMKRSGSSQASIGARASATQPAEKIDSLGRVLLSGAGARLRSSLAGRAGSHWGELGVGGKGPRRAFAEPAARRSQR